MIRKIKEFGLGVATQTPLYRFMPASKYRDYAAIQYFMRVAPSRIPTYISETGRNPNWRYTTMEAAADAAFQVGEDEMARTIALETIDSYPERDAPHLLLSKIDSFRGEYAAAFQHAQSAWLINPGSLAAAQATVRLAYLSQSEEKGDQLAMAVLRKYPTNEGVLWTVCKHCRSDDQFARIRALWSKSIKTPRHVSQGARPLGLAAVHLGQFSVATEIYAEACLIELLGLGVGRELSVKALAGKRGLSVLRDLRNVLEAEDIPFFFAAGTALGIVRSGRPLDHDDDIDVGIFTEHWDRDALLSAFSKHPHFDLEASLPDRPKIRLVHRGGAGIDVFKFYREGGDVFHDGNFVRWRNSEFHIEKRRSSGETVYLPSDIDRYLTENYGNWRVPDKQFDAFVDGPNAEITVPEYHNVHRLRRAYRFIRSTNIIDAHREIAQVKASVAQSEIGRRLIAEMKI